MKLKSTLLLGVAFAITLGAIGLAQSPGVNSNLATVWNIPTDSIKRTYTAGITSLAPISGSFADVISMCGNASYTVRVTRIGLSGRATTPSTLGIQVVRRSTASTAYVTGTPTSISPTLMDTSFSAPVSQPLAWTASPSTLGTLAGSAIVAKQLAYSPPGTPIGINPDLFFGNRPASAIVLRGTAQCVGVQVTPSSVVAGQTFDADIEWTEE